nr:hypothetical protein [uncultured Rhodopila sp.]
MSGLLLGTVALRRFIAGDPVLHDWLEQRPDDAVHLTVVSIGEVLAQAEAKRDVVQRRLWAERLINTIPADFGPRLHSFDLPAAKQWSALRACLNSDPPTFVESDLAVVAIALDRRLDYIAPRESWHDRISGLRQHDPWTATSYPT